MGRLRQSIERQSAATLSTWIAILQTVNDLYGVDRTFHDMEEQGAAQRREGKSGYAGYGGSRKHRDQRNGTVLDALT